MYCDYVAGWISGVVSLLIGHPLDTIKIQQQIRGLTFTEAASRIQKHRGWKGYYRGLAVPLLATGTLNAIFFGVYGDVRDYLMKTRTQRQWALEENLNSYNGRQGRAGRSIDHHKHILLTKEQRAQLKEKNQQATFTELFVSGAVAGIACLSLSVPAELVKTKLQSQMKRKYFKGPFDCFWRIFKEAGIRGIYRGIVPMAARDSIGGGSYFVVYENVKDRSQPYRSSSPMVMLFSGIGGGLAGVAAWTLILPFDTIKSRMQADHHVRPHYRNMVHCGKEILRTDGLIGLYRGFVPCIARAVPVNASIYIMYELLQEKLC